MEHSLLRAASSALLTATLAWCLPAQASDVGRTRLLSGPGEPMRAAVEVINIGAGQSGAATVELADRAAYQQRGLAYPEDALPIDVTLLGPGNGMAVVRLLSTRAPTTSAVTVLLRLRWSDGSTEVQPVTIDTAPALAAGSAGASPGSPVYAERSAPPTPAAVLTNPIPAPGPASATPLEASPPLTATRPDQAAPAVPATVVQNSAVPPTSAAARSVTTPEPTASGATMLPATPSPTAAASVPNVPAAVVSASPIDASGSVVSPGPVTMSEPPPAIGLPTVPAPLSSTTVPAPTPSAPSAPAARLEPPLDVQTVVTPPTPAAIAPRRLTLSERDTPTSIMARSGFPEALRLQALAAIYQNNPESFAGNLYLPKAGSKVLLPTMEQLAAIDPKAARAVLRSNYAAYEVDRSRLAAEARPINPQDVPGVAAPLSAPPATAGSDRLNLSRRSPDIPAAGKRAGAGAGAGVAGTAEDEVAQKMALGEANSRIDQLQRTIAGLQRLIALKDDQMAKFQREQAAATAGVVARPAAMPGLPSLPIIPAASPTTSPIASNAAVASPAATTASTQAPTTLIPPNKVQTPPADAKSALRSVTDSGAVWLILAATGAAGLAIWFLFPQRRPEEEPVTLRKLGHDVAENEATFTDHPLISTTMMFDELDEEFVTRPKLRSAAR